jgi:hypothetical protein
MEKITDHSQLKVGQNVYFNNKKEEGVFKITAIKKGFFGGVDIECRVGKLEPLLLGSDIKSGYIYKTKAKKNYYKQLK